MKKTILMAITLFASVSFAGECKLKITREACAGKETEAYKPYNGKKETEEKKTVADEAACKAEGEKASKIVRKGTLSKKSAVATFDGKEVSNSTGTSECK